MLMSSNTVWISCEPYVCLILVTWRTVGVLRTTWKRKRCECCISHQYILKWLTKIRNSSVRDISYNCFSCYFRHIQQINTDSKLCNVFLIKSVVHQGCIYLIKFKDNSNIVKYEMITIHLKCKQILWWQSWIFLNDPSEKNIIYWFGAQETFLINAENSYSTNYFCENRFFFFWIIWLIIFDE